MGRSVLSTPGKGEGCGGNAGQSDIPMCTADGEQRGSNLVHVWAPPHHRSETLTSTLDGRLAQKLDLRVGPIRRRGQSGRVDWLLVSNAKEEASRSGVGAVRNARAQAAEETRMASTPIRGDGVMQYPGRPDKNVEGNDNSGAEQHLRVTESQVEDLAESQVCREWARANVSLMLERFRYANSCNPPEASLTLIHLCK